MTPEEKHLWYDFLKHLPVTVNRQRKIGKYIVDFYVSTFKIVVELDGSQHFEPENKEEDKERDAWLSANGIKVLRYTNLDIKNNFSGVCDDIIKQMKNRGYRA